MLEVSRKANHNTSVSQNPAQKRRSHTVAVASPDRENASKAKPSTVPSILRTSQTKIPVITGEAHYKGSIPVDGILFGQLGNNGGSLELRQKTKSELSSDEPELAGEITFRDVLRVNGHIAGTVYSENGTLIVDSGALVDANVEVAIAVVRGTVTGDIVAQQRIEIARGAEVLGNIWTRSIAVEVGATFDGLCTMLES